MRRTERGASAWAISLWGMVALAMAMGIGRFAFTPILPMMHEDSGLTVSAGGWLASANYLGYLLGAIAAMRGNVRSSAAIRAGMVAIGLTTLAMGMTESPVAWIVLRFIPGFASAIVLVHVSAWALESLTKAGRPELGGIVYAGVGAGIVLAGGICLGLSRLAANSASAWIALGVIALVACVPVWRAVGNAPGAPVAGVPGHAALREIPEFWRLVLCYGAFGLGYIIPATFLPIMAKQVVPDPLMFGWAWPIFGMAAVVSTLFASRLALLVGGRKVWVFGNIVMAIGVLIPALVGSLSAIVVSALCVGGTFMVMTMVGLQEARRVAGMHARVLMAAMTAAFAAGQIIGPLLVSALVDRGQGFSMALFAAAIPLLAAAAALSIGGGERPGRAGRATN